MGVSFSYTRGARHCHRAWRGPADKCRFLMLLTLLSTVGACCTKPTDRPFPIEALLLDGAAFPVDGVQTRDSDPPGPSGSCNRAGREYFTALHLGIEDIYEYGSVEKATQSRTWHEATVFASNQSTESWTTRPELAFRSLDADYLQQKCSHWRDDLSVCAVVAQYGEFVFRMTVLLYPDTLTFAGFEQVIQAMDERAVLYIKKEGRRTTPEAAPSD